MNLAEYGISERDIVENPDILDHPAMMPHNLVKLPKPVEKMTFTDRKSVV